MSHTAAQLAEEVRGEVLGDGSTPLTGFAPAAAARAGDLTFAEQESYLATAEQSEASAILVPEGITASAKVLIRVANPRIAMARLLPIFFPPEQFEPGIHPSAEITATPKWTLPPISARVAWCGTGQTLGPAQYSWPATTSDAVP